MQILYDFHTYYIVQFWNVFLIHLEISYTVQRGCQSSFFSFRGIKAFCQGLLKKNLLRNKMLTLHFQTNEAAVCAQCLKKKEVGKDMYDV